MVSVSKCYAQGAKSKSSISSLVLKYEKTVTAGKTYAFRVRDIS